MSTPHSFTMSVRFEIDPETGATKVYTDADWMGTYPDADEAGVNLVHEFEYRIKRADNAAVVEVYTKRDPCREHEWAWVTADDDGDTYACPKCGADGYLPLSEIAEMAR